MSLDFLPAEIEAIIIQYKEDFEWCERVNDHWKKFNSCLIDIDAIKYETDGTISTILIFNYGQPEYDEEITYSNFTYEEYGTDDEGRTYEIIAPAFSVSHLYEHYRGNYSVNTDLLELKDGSICIKKHEIF